MEYKIEKLYRYIEVSESAILFIVSSDRKKKMQEEDLMLQWAENCKERFYNLGHGVTCIACSWWWFKTGTGCRKNWSDSWTIIYGGNGKLWRWQKK